MVETTIKELAQRSGTVLSGEERFGHRLATLVFNPHNGPRLDVTRSAGGYDANEQDGWKFLFMGALAGLRNPLAHKAYQPQDSDEVWEIIGFASMLMRGLDLAERRLPIPSPTLSQP